MRTRTMTLVALLTALLCLAGPLTLPVGPVPASLLSAALLLTACLLGEKATLCCLVYLLLGLTGLPVLSGFTGGVAHMVGPTGGFLLGYLPMTYVAGAICRRTNIRLLQACGLLLGTLILYAAGSAWYCLQSGVSLSGALAVCVWPFLPIDLGKIGVVAAFGPGLKARLRKAGVLP